MIDIEQVSAQSPFKWEQITVRDYFVTHKQIEIRDGRTYMRAKKRHVMYVDNQPVLG